MATDTHIRGLLAPLRRVGADFDHGVDIQVITSNVGQVLGVMSASADGSSLGEYPWRNDFGSQLKRLKHANYGDLFNDLVRVFATDAVMRWEPRARLKLGETTFVNANGGHLALIPVASSIRPETSGTAEVSL